MRSRRALEKQAVVLGDGTDADVVAFAQDELEAAVQVFHVRGGRVRGQRGWIVDKVEEVTTGELVEQFLLQVYGGVDEQTGVGEAGEAVPREVLVPELPDDADVYAELLEELRGGRVSLRVPQRGDKRSLLETVERNAKEAFARHRVKRSSDLTARSLALSELQEALDLPDAPLRIECIDVSHVQGTNVVASMVVFEDGLAKKSDYRRFSVAQGTDDTAAMAEVVRRRFARHLKDEEDRRDEQGVAAEEGRPRRFAYPPNLLVVDGGAPQVAAASRSLAELGIVDVAVCGLAKRMEEVWLPGDTDPVILPRTSEALYLLQRVRDEAHRFAITYHRQKRSTSMLVSLLDDVPGLGETRRKALMKQFGSLKRLRAATIEELMAVPGIGRRTAEAVQAAIAEPRRGRPDASDGVHDRPAGAGRARHARAPARATPPRSAWWPRDGRGVGRRRPPRTPRRPPSTSPAGETQPLEVVVVTGLSGAGKNSAGRVLEDLGWFVVDNLPPALLLPMVELGARGDLRRFAAVVDVRSRAFSSDLQEAIRVLSEAGHRPRVVYVHARDEVLVRRYESNRREHPLQGSGTLIDGISAERGAAHRHRRRGRPVGRHQRPQRAPAAGHARERVRPRGPHPAAHGDGHELRLQVRPAAGRRPRGRRPLPAQPALGPRAARRTPVRTPTCATTSSASPTPTEFLDRYTDVLRLLIPGYRREGKRYLTLAVGCTGGKHRSVAIAEEFARRLAAEGLTATARHRDLGRE